MLYSIAQFLFVTKNTLWGVVASILPSPCNKRRGKLGWADRTCTDLAGDAGQTLFLLYSIVLCLLRYLIYFFVVRRVNSTNE